MTDLKKGVIFLEVSECLEPKYKNINKITAKRFITRYSRSILFEDLSGLEFSYTIEGNFSTKNILNFLDSKFRNIKII
jgi:hypothetical protein